MSNYESKFITLNLGTGNGYSVFELVKTFEKVNNIKIPYSIEERREVRSLLNSQFCDKAIIKKFKEELSNLYTSKFDLINDHKLKIDELKINKIAKLLEQKSDEKYNNGDFKGAIKALRRSEKYLAKKNNTV